MKPALRSGNSMPQSNGVPSATEVSDGKTILESASASTSSCETDVQMALGGVGLLQRILERNSSGAAGRGARRGEIGRGLRVRQGEAVLGKMRGRDARRRTRR